VPEETTWRRGFSSVFNATAFGGAAGVAFPAVVCFLCLDRLRERAVAGAVAGFVLLADLGFRPGVFVRGVLGVLGVAAGFFNGEDFRFAGEDLRGPLGRPRLVERLFERDFPRPGDFAGLFFLGGIYNNKI